MTATVTYIRDRAFLELVRARQIARDPEGADPHGYQITRAINLLSRSPDPGDAELARKLAGHARAELDELTAFLARAQARVSLRVRRMKGGQGQ